MTAAIEETPTVALTYTVRLLPKRRHHRKLQAALDTCRALYNAAHEERLGAHNRFMRDEWIRAGTRKAAGLPKTKRRNRAPTLYDQMKALTEIRAIDENVNAVGVSLARGALAALDAAWQAVGKKDALGRTRRPPRFKPHRHDHVLNFHDPKAAKLRNGRLITKPLGAIRYRPHRELPPGRPVAVRLRRDDLAGDARDGRGGRWVALLTYTVEVPKRKLRGRFDGLDVGQADYVTGTGGVILEAVKTGREIDKERRRAQRQLRHRRSKGGRPKRAMSKRGSHRRRKLLKRLRRMETAAANKRRTHARRAAARIAKANDGAAVENPRALAGLYRTRMARGVYDAGWGIFRDALDWACRKAGIPLVAVPTAGTSRDCPACLTKDAFENDLSERWRSCACGWTASRDVTSACEILRRGLPELMNRDGGAPRSRKRPAGGRLVPETPAGKNARRGSPPPSGGCSSQRIHADGSSP